MFICCSEVVFGCTEKLEDLGMLDGCLPDTEEIMSMPQAERKALIRVEKIIGFGKGPHNFAPWFLDPWRGRDRITQQTAEPQ